MSAKLPVAISFSNIANILGTIGVIGSLIFVGLELRQSHKIALAGQIQARNEVASNLLLAPIQGNSNFLSVNGAIQGETEEELLLSTLQAHRALTTLNAWQQYKLGLLDDETWALVNRRAGSGWKNCGAREEMMAQYTDDLIEYALNNLSNESCTTDEEL